MKLKEGKLQRMQEKMAPFFLRNSTRRERYSHFAKNVTGVTRAGEFKTVVKRWILSRSLLTCVRPKSALNHRGPSKSINPGKYNDPRCDCRYKSPPPFKRRWSPIRAGRPSNALMVLARYTTLDVALQFYINLAGDRFVDTLDRT